MERAQKQKETPALVARLKSLLSIFVVLGGLATGAGLLGSLWWPLELFSHFQAQYFFSFLLLSAALFVLRRPRSALLSLALSGLNATLILPLYFGPPPSEMGQRHIRALFANVNTANDNHTALLDLVHQTDPDIVLVQEVNQGWLDSLKPLLTRYPHHLSRAREDNFGIAIYSRLEPESLEIRELAFPAPSVLARLKTPHGPLSLIGAHPPPPAGAHFAQGRNEQLLALADHLASWQGARILLGDLNMTSWSPLFSDLVERSGLSDSRLGYGIQATWPDGFPLLGIPIDHCLISKDLQVTGRTVGPSIGSDHFPVIIDLRFNNPSKAEEGSS